MVFGRLLTAMVTPFDDHGALDANRIKKLVDHLIDHGTEGLVVAGTTGESPTLSHEEKLTLFAEVIEASAGRVPVIAGTGSNNTKTTIELTKEAEKNRRRWRHARRPLLQQTKSRRAVPAFQSR